MGEKGRGEGREGEVIGEVIGEGGIERREAGGERRGGRRGMGGRWIVNTCFLQHGNVQSAPSNITTARSDRVDEMDISTVEFHRFIFLYSASQIPRADTRSAPRGQCRLLRLSQCVVNAHWTRMRYLGRAQILQDSLNGVGNGDRECGG